MVASGDGKVCNPEDSEKYVSVYLGSFMSLDPCGRYHHCNSPNGLTNKCVAFWRRLESAALCAGGCIDSGEGDPTDIYFTYPL
jgi:hypothetical protein